MTFIRHVVKWGYFVRENFSIGNFSITCTS